MPRNGNEINDKAQNNRERTLKEITKHFKIIKINNILTFVFKQDSPINKNKDKWNNYIQISNNDDMVKIYDAIYGVADQDINSMEDFSLMMSNTAFTNYTDAKLCADVRNYARQNYLIDAHYSNYIVRDETGEIHSTNDFSIVDESELTKEMRELIKLKIWPLLLENYHYEKAFNIDKWWDTNERLFFKYSKYQRPSTFKKLLNTKSEELANILIWLLIRQIAITKEKARFLLNWSYLSTTPLKTDAVFLWIYGGGGDGKSIWKEILTYTLPTERYIEIKSNLLNSIADAQDFLSIDLKDKYMCIGDEIIKFNIERLKDLTSPTCIIVAQRKNKESITFAFYGKITLINNTKLDLREYLNDSGLNAFIRRIVYFETMTDKDRQENKLVNKFSSWLLDVWRVRHLKLCADTLLKLSKHSFFSDLSVVGISNMFKPKILHKDRTDDLLKVVDNLVDDSGMKDILGINKIYSCLDMEKIN